MDSNTTPSPGAGGRAAAPKMTVRNNRPERARRFDLRTAAPISLDISDSKADSKDGNGNSNNDDKVDKVDKVSSRNRNQDDSKISKDDSNDSTKDGSNDSNDSNDSSVVSSPVSDQTRPQSSQSARSAPDYSPAAPTNTLKPPYRSHYVSRSLGSALEASATSDGAGLWEGTSGRSSRCTSIESIPVRASQSDTRACKSGQTAAQTADQQPPKASSKATNKKPRKRARPAQLGPEDIKLDDLLACANKALGKFMTDQQVVHDLLSEPMRGPLACLGPVGSLVRLLYRAGRRDELLAPSRRRHQHMVHRPAAADAIHPPIPGLPDTAPMFTSVHALRAAPVLHSTMPGVRRDDILPDRSLLDAAIPGPSGGAEPDDEDSLWDAIERSETLHAGQSCSMALPVWEAITKNYSNKRAPTTTAAAATARPQSPPPPGVHAWQKRRDFDTRRQTSLASFASIAEEDGGSVSGPITQTFHKAVKIAKEITPAELHADQAELIRSVREALLEAEDDIVLLEAEYDNLKSAYDQSVGNLDFVKTQLRLAIRDRVHLQMVVESSEHSKELKEHLVWLILTDAELDPHAEAPILHDDAAWEDLWRDRERRGELTPQRTSGHAESLEWWNDLKSGGQSDADSSRADYQGDVPLRSPWSPAAFASWATGASLPGTPLSGISSRSPFASRTPTSSKLRRSSSGLRSPPLQRLPGTPPAQSKRSPSGSKSPHTRTAPSTSRAVQFDLVQRYYQVRSPHSTRTRTTHKRSRPLKSAMKKKTKQAAAATPAPGSSPAPVATQTSPSARNLKEYMSARKTERSAKAFSGTTLPSVYQTEDTWVGPRDALPHPMVSDAQHKTVHFVREDTPETPEETASPSSPKERPRVSAVRQQHRTRPGLLASIVNILQWVFAWLWRQRTNAYLIVHWCMLAHVVPRFRGWRNGTTRFPSFVCPLWARWTPGPQPQLDAADENEESSAEDEAGSTLPCPREALAELMLFSGVLVAVFVAVFVVALAVAERNLWLDSNATLPREYLYTYIMQYDRDTGSCSANPYMFSSFFRSQYSSSSSSSSPPPATHSPYHVCACFPTFVDPRIALEPMGYAWLYMSDLVWDLWRLLLHRRWAWW